jgi:hypothetical protein
MASKIPEDVAYTITTGYYPQIASKIKYKPKAKGKGATGKKYKKVRGFSDTSINAERARQLQNDGLSEKALLTAEGTGIMAGMKLLEKKRRRDNNQVYYKFRGGTDQYKLYGDQVWYMHGVRERDKNIFDDYINNKKVFGDKHPRFGQVYSKMEPELALQAKSLAEEIFDVALKEVEKELQGAEGTDAAEEIGFTDGEFTYMSHAEAMKLYPEQADSIKKQSKSRANPRDMVVIKDGLIVGSRDVTEMALTQKGQHGITQEAPKELLDAIKEVKGDGRRTAALRQAVIDMFTNAINDDYNPVIRDLKTAAGFEDADSLQGDWSKILKSLSNKGKVNQKGGNTVSVTSLAGVLGVEMVSGGFKHQSDKTARQTSLEYVAHMLGTMNSATNKNFKQSHRVFDHPNGQSVYANVPMITDPDTLLFEPSAVKGTQIVSGYNATLASSSKAGFIKREQTKDMARNQKHAYSLTKVTGMTSSATGRGKATATMGITKTARAATVVTIPADGKIEEALIKDLESKIPNIGHRLGDHGSKLQKRMYGLGNRRKAMRIGEDPNKTQFWALPYIGVLGSEYIKK